MVFVGLTISVGLASANDVYLAQNAAGSGSGSDCADALAYTYFNSSNNWSSSPSGATIGPGTTVHLCGTITGSAGQSLLNAQGSGAQGNPVTILFESGANVTAPYWSSSGAIILNGQHNITVDGGANGTIQNTANGTGRSYQQTTTAISASPCNNCEFKNLTIANLYVHAQCEASSGCDTSVDNWGVNAIQFQGSNILIHDNTMHDIGVVLMQNYTNDNNVQIYNNNIYNMDHGLGCAGAGYVLNNLSIYNNHFHDMANWDTGSADAYHHDGIHCFNGSGGKVQNISIYNNQFDGNEGNCCVTAWIFLEGVTGGTPWTDSTGTAYIFNNVFVGSLDLGNGQVAVDGGNGHQIYNNTVLVTNTGTGACLNDTGGQSGRSATVKNNALSGCDQMYRFDSSVSSLTADHNMFAAGTAGGNNTFDWTNHSSTYSLSTWVSQTGQDTNSAAAIPGSLGASSSGMPQTGSMLIGAGTNLTSLCTGALAPLCKDKAGVQRPATGAWDSGAYYTGTSSPVSKLNPPTNLTAVAH
jgi:hypothetical protein